MQIESALSGYRALLRWAGRFPHRQWAVENARGLGRHLAQWLVARGETVLDVPSTATARVRELPRGGRRKNDVIDAAAAASVAALHGDASPVPAEDLSTVLSLLEERRANLAAARTRAVNQLHALLRDLIPGGAPTDLSAAAAAGLLTGVRPASPVEQARKQLARDLILEIRGVDARMAAIAKRMSTTLTEYGSRLPDVDGIGPVLAARIVGRTGRATRFPSTAAFASYAGVAPIEVASGDRARHRLSRSGDRQLNCALHLVAVTQVRMRTSKGRAYYDTKRAAGKTHNEAMRCLKRRIADHVWRLMVADERCRETGPGGHTGTTLQSSATGSTPTTSSSDKSLPGPATVKPTTTRGQAA
jgi:transposase